MQLKYSFTDSEDFVSERALIELKLVKDILSGSLKVSDKVYERCKNIKNNLNQLVEVLSSDKTVSLFQLRYEPWCYEELKKGYYKGKYSIRLTNKDRLIFEDNDSDNDRKLFIFGVLFHYPKSNGSFEENLKDEDDLELLHILKDYLSDKNVRERIEALYNLSEKNPHKIWFFLDSKEK